jgi:hypothetical protein
MKREGALFLYLLFAEERWKSDIPLYWLLKESDVGADLQPQNRVVETVRVG